MKTELKTITAHTLFTDWAFIAKGTQIFQSNKVTGISELFKDLDGKEKYTLFTTEGKFKVFVDTLIETDTVKINGYDDWGWTEKDMKAEER